MAVEGCLREVLSNHSCGGVAGAIGVRRVYIHGVFNGSGFVVGLNDVGMNMEIRTSLHFQ